MYIPFSSFPTKVPARKGSSSFKDIAMRTKNEKAVHLSSCWGCWGLYSAWLLFLDMFGHCALDFSLAVEVNPKNVISCYFYQQLEAKLLAQEEPVVYLGLLFIQLAA